MKKNIYETPTYQYYEFQEEVLTSSAEGMDFYEIEDNPWENSEH